ncbi:Elongator subunit IKI1 [Lachancea thermotolerans CBS 6340]|uniref:Elongator complex protein 5 n=1 Tax=Lachancea thermotolerans (strain ATCC 56472 / CBS 6340 / NRRL Y-8284) TaxID=559295 RepID=C5DD71_LACTC|nr:KLTH0B08822p [Lachancea thermotolerans CBS 6340]CAR21732.1 KLTH0B08822p [Lachancea thermotolerans CBS 6340]
MASSSHNPAVLLKRVLSLRESSPFILCVDCIERSASSIVEEVSREVGDSATIIYVSYETNNKPRYATHFVEGTGSEARLLDTIKSYLPSKPSPRKHLVIIDTLNLIPNNKLSQFISSMVSPSVVLLGIYHKQQPEVRPSSMENYPSSLQLLQFMATSILDCQPITEDAAAEEMLDSKIQKLVIPRGLNSPVFKLVLTNRRKSGRALTYSFQFDSRNHTYNVLQEQAENENTEDDKEVFEGLTTFNLNISNRQKAARENVALPFLEAQSFNAGGAIVYEYEKDDDYDEEDPYEDPF